MYGSRPRFVPVAVLVLVLLAGSAAIAYARWTAPLVAGDRAVAEGRHDAALAAFGEAERRLGRFAVTRFLFAAPHAAAVYNQLGLLYRGGDHEGVLAKAAGAPAAASPHLWSGLALLRLGMAEGYADRQVTWFTRAEEELRQALEAAPGDWDAKFNYEIAARIVAELRRNPKKRIDDPMQLLRPQPAQAPPVRKVG
jgi:mxaK protein